MSMFETGSILPNNSTPFERILEQAANFPSLPISELAELINPQAIDARYLPWLAYRFHIEIWVDDWSEERKRSVIARALELQRMKGTVRGLREYVKLVDARVQQIVTAPQHVWAGAGLTKEQIDAWHESLPQIRIYFVSEQMKTKQGLSFIGHCFVGHNLFGAGFGLGRALNGRKARLWDRGEETPLKLIEFETINQTGQAVKAERVSLAGLAGKSAFMGSSFFGTGFLQALEREPKILTWNREITYSYPGTLASTTSLNPSFKPIDIRASRKSDKWRDQYCCAEGRFIGHCFLVPSRAGERLYDCLALHDPARALPRMRGLSFTDVSFIGHPAFEARALIDLQEKAHPRAAFMGHGFLGRHFIMAQDKQKREGVRRAVVLSKAARDKILVSHQTSRPLTFGDGAAFGGSITFNARIKNRI